MLIRVVQNRVIPCCNKQWSQLMPQGLLSFVTCTAISRYSIRKISSTSILPALYQNSCIADNTNNVTADPPFFALLSGATGLCFLRASPITHCAQYGAPIPECQAVCGFRYLQMARYSITHPLPIQRKLYFVVITRSHPRLHSAVRHLLRG
ncbi:hypothetical protein BDV29DRAFT_165511 [Aspergillus leporis]|uniref:Uncharacterized protein n=1 Tax=Aspergillus leporis TaxID=41062 RepID=A0A5N5XHI3_9EURO|nr:hypothetical protein BDV29DRAFT_165511 [Aspergillus leporis]